MLAKPVQRIRAASTWGTQLEEHVISVTRLKGQVVALNPDMIESVEENPDTTIRLTSGERLLVRESLAEVVQLVTSYRRYLLSALAIQPLSGGVSHPPPPTANKR